MRKRQRLLGWIPLALALTVASSVAAAETASRSAGPAPESASPVQERPGPTLWLKGAFGRVRGGPPDQPATTPPGGGPLDAWMRAAPMELLANIPGDDVVDLAVVAEAVDGGASMRLSEGATEFLGPDAPGRYVITAMVETAAGATVQAWLVDVPDRSGGPELLWEIPGPTALLSAGGAEVAGIPGHGCYLYLCVEAGYRPPIDSLEPLTLASGEAPQVRLDDGSIMSHWIARLESPATPGLSIDTAESPAGESAGATPVLDGLEPPMSGVWLLEVRADFDRHRGWQWFLFRLDVE